MFPETVWERVLCPWYSMVDSMCVGRAVTRVTEVC